MQQHTSGITEKGSDEVRFAELVWRTFKMRALAMVITLGAIAVTWSTLEAGFAKAHQIDVAFLERQVQLLTNAGIKTDAIEGLADRTESGVALLIGMERRLLPLVALASVDDKKQTPDQAAKERAFYRTVQAELEAYDRKRREAFLVELSLPYLVTRVSVNALAVADIWPVCVLVILVVVALLRSQQHCYEVILSSCVGARRDSRERARVLARSEFYAGTLRAHNEHGEVTWLYERPLTVLPATLFLDALLVAIVLASLAMLGRYDPTAHHPTQSIIFSYYSLLWCLLVAATAAGWMAHKYYMQRLADALGGRVESQRLFWLRASLRRWATRMVRTFGVADRLLGIVSIVALSTLAMPWVQPLVIRGYKFLWRQTPISVTSTADTTIVLLPIDPRIFFEMRLHVAVACVFLLACALRWLVPTRWNVVKRASSVIERYLAYVVLFAAGNFFLYELVVWYQAVMTDLAQPVMDLLLGPGGDISAPRGLPLALYSPTVYFGVFSVCLIALAARVASRSKS